MEVAEGEVAEEKVAEGEVAEGEVAVGWQPSSSRWVCGFLDVRSGQRAGS